MTALPQKSKISVSEYFEIEQLSDIRCEYWDGNIVERLGDTHCHNQIIRNLMLQLGNVLNKSECSPFSGETRLHVPACKAYFYPDIQVVCGKVEYLPLEAETVSNPSVIVEVLSTSTEAADRGRKFACYRTINSLKYYILIDQYSFNIDLYTLESENRWLLTSVSGEDALLSLTELGLELSLRERYSSVLFECQGPILHHERDDT